MSCGRASEVDLAAYAAEPGAPAWAEFRAHYPRCPDCSRAVAEWARLGAALAEAPGAGAAHPAEDELLAYAEAPQRLARERRRALDRHLEGCAPCRSEMRVLRDFAFEALAAPEAAAPGPLRRLADFLQELGASFAQPAWAAALLVLLAIPLGVALWRSSGSAPDAPPLAERREPAPAAPRAEAPALEPPPVEQLAGQSPPVEQLPGQSPPVEQLARQSPAVVEPSAPPDPAPPVSDAAPAPPAVEELARRQSGPESAPPPPGPTVDPVAELLEPREIASLLPAEPPRYAPQLALAGGPLERLRTRSVVRGAGAELPALHVLGPEHVAVSASAAPVLYWHLSAPSPVPVTLTLIAEDAIEPLLEERLDPPLAAGLHAFSLAERGLRLAPGVSYDWYVALQPEPDAADAAVLSRLGLRHAPPEPALAAALAADPAQRVHRLAAAGYWLDAFAALEVLAEAAPGEARPAAHRQALLEQVELGEVAAQLGAAR